MFVVEKLNSYSRMEIVTKSQDWFEKSLCVQPIYTFTNIESENVQIRY